MVEYYLQIRLVHICAVAASGILFFLRGLAMGFGKTWGMAAPVRYLSYTIDTILLTAALMLTTIINQYPFVDSWLTVKVTFLVVYIVLGSFALKRGKTLTDRLGYWLTALVVYSYIISVAVTKNPQGFLQFLP
jgi:uncharacterized membrane protein SirB2